MLSDTVWHFLGLLIYIFNPQKALAIFHIRHGLISLCTCMSPRGGSRRISVVVGFYQITVLTLGIRLT